MNEFDIIDKLSKISGHYQGSLNLKDDAAIIDANSDNSLVISKDIIIEEIHFPYNTSSELIAKKAMRTSISDLAAMGAKPKFYLLGLTLRRHSHSKWVENFTNSLGEDIKKFGGSLIGGDTTSHDGPVTISMTVIGSIPKNQKLLRSTAQVNDDIYVTGYIGDSHLGLNILKNNSYNYLSQSEQGYLINRYNIPQPRLDIGKKLRNIASACIDISDGLVQDLSHICKQSKISAQIKLEELSLSNPAKIIVNKEGIKATEDIITGGDDYELLFTASKKHHEIIKNIAKETNIPITKIGITTKDTETIFLLNNKEIKLESKGFEHKI